MTKDNRKFYENFDWESLKSSDLKEKIQLVLDLIPLHVESILDVGCGNGAITNVLAESYDITGVDRSKEALKYVTTKKILASADAIPLRDKQFDLVFSSELLEHLEEITLKNTVHEISRLTNNYLLISVPNDENPDKLSIRCPKCNFDYNRPNHINSFNEQKLSALFPDFRILKTVKTGKSVRYYAPALLKLKKRFSSPNSWIPYYWIAKDKRSTVCPSCEHEFEYGYKFHPVASFIDTLNVLVSPKKPYWLMILFQKK
ncbi:MAG: class I SAM-dependent methyltransferase [Bacteroidetes bacterium]|nr:class I SAM-dependent methyltransferase [Bacteroidota bacterium]